MLLDKQEENLTKKAERCPYCQGSNIVKKGIRRKKLEEIQIYFCKNCGKKFVPQIAKNKTYPLRIILEALTLYNRLATLEQISQKIAEKYGLKINCQTVVNWVNCYKEQIPFLRFREFAAKKYAAKDMIEEVHLTHGQIYDFKYHRAKTEFLLNEDFKNYRLGRLKEFLELVGQECPHTLFRESQRRASEYRNFFNIDQVKITDRNNAAPKIVRLVMQAVANNNLRHEVLQEFMLANDSVTVAVEVPVLLEQDDILHFRNELCWNVPIDLPLGEAITGHIDIVQLRNGAIHIMDYKPSAKKVKPIDQLTLYALALSRLTSIRLYYFKCAWFDEDNYFEFYPLHVVMKKKKKAKSP